jgi:hypothetical protein
VMLQSRFWCIAKGEPIDPASFLRSSLQKLTKGQSTRPLDEQNGSDGQELLGLRERKSAIARDVTQALAPEGSGPHVSPFGLVPNKMLS